MKNKPTQINRNLHKPTGWKNSYPLNTFKGETKRELVDFISHQLELERERTQKLGEKNFDSGRKVGMDIGKEWERERLKK